MVFTRKYVLFPWPFVSFSISIYIYKIFLGVIYWLYQQPIQRECFWCQFKRLPQSLTAHLLKCPVNSWKTHVPEEWSKLSEFKPIPTPKTCFFFKPENDARQDLNLFFQTGHSFSGEPSISRLKCSGLEAFPVQFANAWASWSVGVWGCVYHLWTPKNRWNNEGFKP